MKEVRFNVACQATYQGSLQVPDDIGRDELLLYIQDRLGEVPAVDLEWIGGDNVEAEDIQNWEDFEAVV